MNLSKRVISFIPTLGVFLALDALWLGVIARDLYQVYLGDFLSPTPNWGAAWIFYLIFVVGIFVFVINPALDARSWKKSLILWAWFGLVTYATYDLTNLATLEGFPITIVVLDLVWWMFLTSSVSVAWFFITQYLSHRK